MNRNGFEHRGAAGKLSDIIHNLNNSTCKPLGLGTVEAGGIGTLLSRQSFALCSGLRSIGVGLKPCTGRLLYRGSLAFGQSTQSSPWRRQAIESKASNVQEMDRSAWCYDTTTTQSHIPYAVRATVHRWWSEQGNRCATASATLCASRAPLAAAVRQHAHPAKSQQAASLIADEKVSDDLVTAV